MWHKCPEYKHASVASAMGRKGIRYERDGEPCEFLIEDPSEYALTRQDDCEIEIPELMRAVDCWLEKRRQRKQGWQFKCIIADGEKKISNWIPSRSGRVVQYVLVEREVTCQCGGEARRNHVPAEDVANLTDEVAATMTTGVEEALEPGSTETASETVQAVLEEARREMIPPRPRRTCGLSTFMVNGRCDDIQVT